MHYEIDQTNLLKNVLELMIDLDQKQHKVKIKTEILMKNYIYLL